MSKNPNYQYFNIIKYGQKFPENILKEQNGHEIPINELSELCHNLAVSAGWHINIKTKKPVKRNTGELLMLMVSEISEAMEADRKSLMDDKLTNRLGIEAELADCMIRIFDFAGSRGLDLQGALYDKLHYNTQREDHKINNRLKNNGKSY